LIVIIGGAAAYFLLTGGGGLLRPQAPAATPTPQTVEVVAAGQTIPKAAILDEGMLTMLQWPENLVTASMFRNMSEVVGKYAKYQLDQGHVISTADVATSTLDVPEGGSEAARLIPNGMVAISVPMNKLGLVSYGIQDGDHVDLIVSALFVDVDPSFQSILPNLAGAVTLAQASGQQTVSVAAGSQVGRTEIDPVLNAPVYVIPAEPQRPRLVSQMILQDIQVLHVGDFALPGTEVAAQPTPGPTPTPGPPPPPVAPSVITLIVTPQDAVTLTYLRYSGAKMGLVLRGVDDQTRVQTESATLQFLLSQYGITIPAKLSNAMTPKIEQILEPGEVITVNP
jgi:pilus assembly protein CpaB